jgi:hypothetical protein
MACKGKTCNGYSLRLRLVMTRHVRVVHVRDKHVGQ